MKRFFILASAAIVALASCAKTEVVYKDAPEKITFKQVTDVMTKATNLSDQLTLGVFANEEDGDVYFGNTAFTYSEGTWGNNSAYWPYEGNLVFTVYAPAGTAAYVETEVEEDSETIIKKVMTLSGVTAAEDLYYGVQRYSTSKVTSVPVTLKHVSAQVTVTVNTGDKYDLTGLTLTTPTTEGDVTVDYTTNTTTVATKTITTGTDLALTSGETKYVLPGNQTSIVVNFKQKDGAQQTYSKTISLNGSTWDANTKYTYTIGITAPELIKFTAEVGGWDEAEDKTATLN